MTETKRAPYAPVNTNIYFMEERSGYNREQADNYISKLSQEYQAVYNKHQSIVKKYNALLEDCKKPDVQERTGLNPDIAAKTLMHTELLTQKIIADAHAEATAVRTAAKEDSKRITDDAYVEKTKTKLQAEKILGEAKIEADKIISDARQELTVIRNKRVLLIAEINSIANKLKSLASENESISVI